MWRRALRLSATLRTVQRRARVGDAVDTTVRSAALSGERNDLASIRVCHARHLEKFAQHGVSRSDDDGGQHQQYDPDEDDECQMTLLWLHDYCGTPMRPDALGR